jgi:ADP-ribose pyrophosphatase YjhB (NUDIX family)
VLADPGYSFCPKCGTAFGRRRLKEFEPERLVCPSCGFVMYLNPKVAAGVVVEHEGGIVLLKREVDPRAGYWVHPGGFVDRGETLEAAAKREAFEEVGLEVEIGDLLGAFSYPNSEVVIVSFAGRVTGGTLKAGDEAIEARPFDRAAIPWADLAFPSTVASLRAYLDLAAAPSPPSPAQSPGPDTRTTEILRAQSDAALLSKDVRTAFVVFPELVRRLRATRRFDEALRYAEAGLELTHDPSLARVADEIAHEKAEADSERC